MFDTGFQRELTLSSSDSAMRGIIRGPQPETVKDYVLLADGKSYTLEVRESKKTFATRAK